jgi:energy-converting hydrogenase Eha subunit B
MFSILADATADQTTALAAMSAFFGTIMIVGLAITALTVWLFWRIFAKAGFNGALGLLCLIPSVGIIICIVILAFGTWPIEMRNVPPGTTMMPT